MSRWGTRNVRPSGLLGGKAVRRWIVGVVLITPLLAFLPLLVASTPATALTDPGQAIVAAASSQAGMPYCWAGGDTHGPTHGSGDLGHGGCGGTTVGFDCSGLVL